MNHGYDLAAVHLDRPSVVTIGVFDGVHRGHQHLIRRLVAEARRTDRLAVVLTFFPHPDVVLRGLSGRYYLTTPDQRAELMGELGVDHVITLPFNEDFRQIRAGVFVDMMRDHLRLESLWVGADFAMGYKREGNIGFLRAQGADKGFALETIALVGEDGTHTFSSTAIREALLRGDVEIAQSLLGRPYGVSGEVVHGDHRGRTIGFPTANIAVWEEQVVPANGVYAGWATLDGERYMAATNVGLRPTFAGQELRVEAYLLDFDRDIYGKTLSFSFEQRLRPEKKFSGIDELIAQIRSDAESARSILQTSLRP
ncbi:MAG: bifunctional riboflavin kinase/FAD synthetase [Anaerolinea sp.]|nr:bifunctional riboflavin kinase/FAD synthetase [Anaerolinea sp.]